MSSEWSVAHDEREGAESSRDSKQMEKHARPLGPPECTCMVAACATGALQEALQVLLQS